jgi:P-type conjugative transfer protein TrbJ
MMKKMVMAILVVFFTVISCGVVFAGGGATGGSTEATQLANKAQLIEQVKKAAEQINNQITQITNQITMIQDMVHNTMALPDQLFSTVGTLYGSIDGVMKNTMGLAYQMASIDDQMMDKFKSYADLKGKIKNAPQFQSEYKSIIDTQRETARDTMKTLGIMQEDLEDDYKILEKLQEKASTAQGRNQLLAAANQFAAYQAQTETKLRELIMAQLNLTTVVIEAERTQSDVAQAEHEAMWQPMGYEKPSIEVDRYGY